MDQLASRLARGATNKSKPKKGVKRLCKEDTKENKKKIVSKVDSVALDKQSKKEKNLQKQISSRKKELIKDVLLKKDNSQIKNLTKQNAKDKVSKLKKVVKENVEVFNKSINKKVDKSSKKLQTNVMCNNEAKTPSISKKRKSPLLVKEEVNSKVTKRVKIQPNKSVEFEKNLVSVVTNDGKSKKLKKNKLQPNKSDESAKNSVDIKTNDGKSKKLKKNKLQPKKSVVESIDAICKIKKENSINFKKLEKKVKSQIAKKVKNKKSQLVKSAPVEDNEDFQLVENVDAISKVKKDNTIDLKKLGKIKSHSVKELKNKKLQIVKSAPVKNNENFVKAKVNAKALKKVNSKVLKPAALENSLEIKDIKSKKRKQPEENEKTSGPTLKKKEVINFVKALIKVNEIKEENKKNLFDVEKPPILLNINCFKIPKVPLHQHRITLPHSMVNSTDDVAIFVKDLKKGRRRDPEETIRHYEDIFQQKGITQIKTIIPINQLKTEYRQFEMRRRLFNSHDYFLVDGCISGHIAHLLGKQFREKRKLPASIHMNKENLKKEIDSALLKTCLQIHGHGDHSIIQIGTCSMKVEHIADNILAVIEDLSKNFPGKWENIRSLGIKTPLSLTIPIYISLKNKNEVEVPVLTPKRPKAYQEVEGELSTFTSDIKVHVTPDGTVRLERIQNDGNEETKEAVEKVEIKQEKLENGNTNAKNKVEKKKDDEQEDEETSDGDEDEEDVNDSEDETSDDDGDEEEDEENSDDDDEDSEN